MISRYSIELPVGEFIVFGRDDVALAAGFGERNAIGHLQDDEPIGAGSRTDAIARALRAWRDGDVRALDRLKVSQDGSPFMSRVWTHMRRIPAGETASYAELAAQAGNARAVRAAGSACARNTIPLIVPCHRVVRSDGTLGNYYYGTDVKRWLLEHEARAVAAA